MITTLVVTMTAIYYMLMGYQIMAGSVQKPITDFLKSGIKFIVISSLALSAGNYGEWVQGSLEQMASGIASTWSGTSGDPYSILDQTLTQMFDKGLIPWKKASSLDWTEIDKALMLGKH
jgi:hypothetical protein